MSDPAPPPSKAPPQEGKTHTVQVSITFGVKTLYYILVAMSTIGVLMLWFEADKLRSTTYWSGTSSAAKGHDPSGQPSAAGRSAAAPSVPMPPAPTGNVHPFTNLWIAILMFVGVDLSDVFIPPFAKKLVRSLATFIYFFNIDLAICTLNTYTLMGDGENHVSGYPSQINERNMARMGAALVMLPAIFIIFVTYFRKRPNFNGLLQGGLPSLIFFVRIIAFMLFLFAQVMVWSIKTNCAGPAWGGAANAMTQWTIMVQLILMISGCFFGDNEAYDLSLFFVMWNLWKYAPYFEDIKALNGNQDAFPGLWRTEVSMVFIASQLYTFCAFCDGKRDKSSTVIERVKSKPFIVQVICAVFGFAAAICIWVRSPEPDEPVTYFTKAQVYLGCYALIIPIYEMLATLTGSGVIHLFCLGYTALLGYFVAIPLNSGVWGYLRGGFIIEMFICFISVLITHFLGLPDVKPIHEYFEGDGKTAVVVSGIIAYFSALGYENGRIDYMLWFALSLYIFLGRLTNHHDLQRICYFVLMWVLTNTSNSVAFWPLLPGQGPKVLESTLFVIGMYYIWQFAVSHQGKEFECVQHFGEDDIGAAQPAARRGGGASEGKYESLDDGNNAADSKSESLLTRDSKEGYGSPDNKNENGGGGYQASEIDESETEASPDSKKDKKEKRKSKKREGRSRSSSVASSAAGSADDDATPVEQEA